MELTNMYDQCDDGRGLLRPWDAQNHSACGGDRGRERRRVHSASPPQPCRGCNDDSRQKLAMSKGSAKRSAKSAAPSVPAKRYEPTPNEQAALDAFKARQAARAPSPHLKVSGKGNVAELAPDHPDRETAQTIMMESLGSADSDFVDGLLAQAGLICRYNLGTDEYERQLNFILSVVRSIKPRDEIEAMLGAQMATVHMASMTSARRLAHVDNIAQQDSAPDRLCGQINPDPVHDLPIPDLVH